MTTYCILKWKKPNLLLAQPRYEVRTDAEADITDSHYTVIERGLSVDVVFEKVKLLENNDEIPSVDQ